MDNMTEIKIPQSVQKEVRGLNLDELYILFEGLIKNNKYDKDRSCKSYHTNNGKYKIALLAYLEKRIKKLQKQKDYEDKNISDSEFVAKWETK